MKLSEKGAKKVFEHAMWGDGYYDLEDAISVNLEPDDFTNCVVLTLDEAKDVLHSLNCAWSRCPVKAECKDLVKKKIEQAEGK